MEWVALVLWIVLTIIALPLGGLGAFVAPSLTVQTVAAITGLVLCILFIAGDGVSAFLWIAFGAGVVGCLAAFKAGAYLVRDDRPLSPLGQDVEEHTALMVGIQSQLFLATAAMAFLAAIGLNVGS